MIIYYIQLYIIYIYKQHRVPFQTAICHCLILFFGFPPLIKQALSAGLTQMFSLAPSSSSPSPSPSPSLSFSSIHLPYLLSTFIYSISFTNPMTSWLAFDCVLLQVSHVQRLLGIHLAVKSLVGKVRVPYAKNSWLTVWPMDIIGFDPSPPSSSSAWPWEHWASQCRRSPRGGAPHGRSKFTSRGDARLLVEVPHPTMVRGWESKDLDMLGEKKVIKKLGEAPKEIAQLLMTWWVLGFMKDVTIKLMGL